MPRQFRTVDYEATLDSTVRLRDLLPDDHLARFVADLVAALDVSAFYARYGPRGGLPYTPEVLLAVMRQMEQVGQALAARVPRPRGRPRKPQE